MLMTPPTALALRLTFVTPDGPRAITARPGTTLMEAARDAGIAGIVAECGGACVCATCHVHVKPEWLALTGTPSATEAEMLDFALEADETSRLSCQIRLTEAMDGLTVRVPERQA
ncbi:2Fe-2S iron-sulfur cluster-binding protein [Haematobacter massiliensis]|uniref:2Fe-2S iron-sulfur cluster-binding protein n=1 Tax=Haematobacter massiliensis TaxID=195105 RepID=UPI000A40A065|nr:2Fe-2S iron-sulfur cluster-binding protein [Haematobacter massiliensis]